MKTLTNYQTREQWLEARSVGVGASEVAVLFGVAPDSWGSIYSMWLEKTGRSPQRQLEGEYLEIGTLMEPVAAELYVRRTGRKLWDGGGPFCVAANPRLPFFRCTPDRLVVDAPGMDGVGDLQLKNAGWYMTHDWDEGMPDHVMVQVQSEMSCLDVQWGSAAPIIGGNSFRHFDIARDDRMIAEIEAQVEWFWGMVVRDEEPPIDGSEATARALKALHQDDNDLVCELLGEAAEWLDEWQAANAIRLAVENEQKPLAREAENKIRAAIGSNTYGRLPDGRLLSLKTTSKKEYLSPATKYRQLRVDKKSILKTR